MIENDPVTFNKFKINIITVNDEYDAEDTKKDVDGIHNLLILGKYAGVGNTTLAVKLGTNILIIGPYSALCQENDKNGCDGITYDKLFGIVVNCKDVSNFIRVDISDYELIISMRLYHII